MNEKKIKELDEAIVKYSKKIKVLSALAWPAGEEYTFLENWHNGNPKLPQIELPRPDVMESVVALEQLARKCDSDDPVEKFLRETATSYAVAGRMISAIGTPDFTRYSVQIYGRPDRKYKNQTLTAVDAAKFFLSVTDSLLSNPHVQPAETNISALEFAGWLRAEVDEFFSHDTIEVVVDPNMSSKALAGATRIRVRGSAVFSQLDKDQLLYHEAYVHTATQLNGKKQPNLKSLGLGAPRTTRTQEGIAVLAELVTNAIDITRLRRVALRVIAVQMAIEGADFIDLFRFFVDAGQPDIESVRSAQRIFRGGAVKGGVVFTKDAVYLSGVLEVHTFLRIAIRDNRPDLVNNLFAGRLTIADTVRLAPLFDKGWLKPPVYIPTWAADLRRLAAMMAYSAFIGNIKIDDIRVERAIELEEEMNND